MKLISFLLDDDVTLEQEAEMLSLFPEDVLFVASHVAPHDFLSSRDMSVSGGTIMAAFRRALETLPRDHPLFASHSKRFPVIDESGVDAWAAMQEQVNAKTSRLDEYHNRRAAGETQAEAEAAIYGATSASANPMETTK
jgi:hypothetical protein